MIALIDGDVLCYQACERRWSSKSMVDNTIYIEMDSNGKVKPFEYTKEENRQYLEQCWKNFQSKLQDLLDSVFATDYLMAVKGPDNFRNLMYPGYKMNRHADPTKQNEFVPILRKLAVAEDFAVESYGREADDLLRIWAEEARAAGDPYIVCTIDKDLKCIPGNFYNMKHEEIIKISEEEAIRHYYEQLLKGDPTDNIPGVPRVGEVKAAKMLANCKTEEEFQEVVVSQYIAAYNEDWHNYLLSNGKMIYLQKSANDYFSLETWPIVKELL